MFIDWHGAENILRPCFFKEIDLPLYFKQPKDETFSDSWNLQRIA